MESFLLRKYRVLDMAPRRNSSSHHAVNDCQFLHVRRRIKVKDLLTFILFLGGWVGGW